MTRSSLDNPMDRFERLARLAREDSPPAIDVTERVLSQLRERTDTVESLPVAAPPDREWVGLLVGAGIAVTAAAIALTIGVPSWESMNDPLAGWFDQFNVVLQ